jgi:ABC-type nitrate/sulfonate/bicarbonate transport system substrate-binding protein
MTNMLPFSLIVRPEIKTAEDLRGKRVGASVGSTTYALVYEYLRLHKIDPEKGVEYVNMSGAAPRIAAMEKGILAATPLAPPGDLRALQLGFRRLVFFGDVLPEIAFTGLVGSSAYIRDNPKITERMVRAIVRATQMAQNDSTAAIETMTGTMKMSPDDARDTYKLVRKSFTPALTETGLRNMASLVSRAVGVKAGRDPREYMDQSFLNRALVELRGK